MQSLQRFGHKCVTCAYRPAAPSIIFVRTTLDFFHPKPGAEYADQHKKPKPRQLIKTGMKLLPHEVKKWGEEFRDKFVTNPIVATFHGDYEVLFKFDNTKIIDEWMVTTDRMFSEGKSQAEFVLGQNKTGIFRGFVNTDVPKDGIIKQAGYCNIRSETKKISFARPVPYDLSLYTHLLFRIRGDGRPYQVQLSMDRYFDVQYHDQYIYPLFTRGGPYWQLAHIPLSKFFLSSKGRIQDAQERIQADKIQTFGVTIGDGVMGPFQLEIDFIAAIKDERHKEEFAYEMYETSGASLY